MVHGIPVPKLTEQQFNRLELLVENALAGRLEWLRNTLDPRRNIDDECGFPSTVSPEKYYDLYRYDSVANRAVEVRSRETWKRQPEFTDEQSTDKESEFDIALQQLNSRLRGYMSYHRSDEESSALVEYMLRADIAAHTGQYGVVLIGIDDGLPLDKPARGVVERFSMPATRREDGSFGSPGFSNNYSLAVNRSAKNELLYMRVFPEALAYISQYESNPTSPRYCQPTQYNITFNDNRSSVTTRNGLAAITRSVHWTRVVHILNENTTVDEVVCAPTLEPILRDVLSLEKIDWGSAEGFWKSCFAAISLETNPQLGGDVDVDEAKIRNMMERFWNGLDRGLLLKGLSAKQLAPSVADPTPHAANKIERICIKLNVPVPVFKGYEIGEQASTNNKSDWDARMQQRMRIYATPRVACPILDRFILLNVLPEPKDGYCVKWPDIAPMTAMEQADIALKRTQTLTTYISGNGQQLISPKDQLSRVMGYTDDEADAMLDSAADYVAEQPNEPEAQEPDEPVDNVFCSTGKGGGVDPTCGKGDGSHHVTGAIAFSKMSPLVKHKIEVLNPNPDSLIIKVPKAAKDSHVAAIKAAFPDKPVVKVAAGHIKLGSKPAKSAAAASSAPPLAYTGKNYADAAIGKAGKMSPIVAHKIAVLNPSPGSSDTIKVPKAIKDKHFEALKELYPDKKVLKVSAGHIKLGSTTAGGSSGGGMKYKPKKQTPSYESPKVDHNNYGLMGTKTKTAYLVSEGVSESSAKAFVSYNNNSYGSKFKLPDNLPAADQTAIKAALLKAGKHVPETTTTKAGQLKGDVTSAFGAFESGTTPNPNKEALAHWANTLKPAERYAIKDWSGGGYTNMRKRIAAGTPSVHDKALLSGLETAPKMVGVMHRGIKVYGNDSYGFKEMQAIVAAGVGGTWTDKAPHSLSRSTDKGIDFADGGLLLKVHTKTARQMENVSGIPSELESIGMPGTKYKILAVHTDAVVNGTHHHMYVELQEI